MSPEQDNNKGSNVSEQNDTDSKTITTTRVQFSMPVVVAGLITVLFALATIGLGAAIIFLNLNPETWWGVAAGVFVTFSMLNRIED